jgi:hypothetical protein
MTTKNLLMTAPAAGGFAPDDISGLSLWLDADAFTGMADGDAIATWADGSVVGNDVSQTTPANRPTYKTGIQNGLAVARFDGSDDRMDGLTYASLTTAGNMTVFEVAGGFSTTIPLMAVGGKFLLRGGTWWISVDQGGVSCATPTSISLRTQVANFDTDSHSLRFNGAAEATQTQPTTPPSSSVSIEIGYGFGGAVRLDICEVLIYNSALSAGDITNVETDLNDKWAVY